MITHTERIMACLRGESLDRPPVALWRHFPVDDQHPGSLAAATLHFQKTYDFDLVKVTPASSFCLRDWGVEDAWRGNPEGTRDYIKRIISKPEDWETLPMLETSATFLAAQLECLRLIRRELPDTPILQTIFSPLSQAKNLAGKDTLLLHLRQFPEAVLKGLDTIAKTTTLFIAAALETGIDGIFYAVQHAQAHLLTWEDYQLFGLPFDRRILLPAAEGWCNMLHLHGHNIYFDLVSHLPVQIVNWHDRETPPALSRAASQGCNVAVCGGLRQDTLVYSDPASVAAESAQALSQTGGHRLVLSTGCVVPVIAPHGNYIAARRSVESAKTNDWSEATP